LSTTVPYNKAVIATAVAILFHLVGLTGILFFDRSFFVSLTPWNLLLSVVLLIWSQPSKNGWFYLFLFIAFATGFFAEFIGVNYQWLFGSYEYGSSMGVQYRKVPWIIGVNWAMMMVICGMSVQIVLNGIWNRLKNEDEPVRNNVGFVAVILDGALLATFFDWVMEPVAVQLGYWKWLGDGTIPTLNYLSWFGVSALLLLVFRLFPFRKDNQFALHLLLIQLMFFLILRTFL